MASPTTRPAMPCEMHCPGPPRTLPLARPTATPGLWAVQGHASLGPRDAPGPSPAPAPGVPGRPLPDLP